ncbi:MAG: acyl--CoA ligase [Firmicutes bacterium]|nr:acyl--CoA ligase [Bacillota bacterium]
MSILYAEMKKAAEKNADKVAIVFYGKRYKFARVLSLVERAAFGLSDLGVKKGDVVTLCLPNTPSAFVAFYALNRLGATVNLVHPFISAAGLSESVKKTDSRLVIAYDLFLRDKGEDLSGKLAEVGPDIKVIKSRSDHFMGFFAKIYFGQSQRKKGGKRAKQETRKQKYRIFESIFKNAEITVPAVQIPKTDPAVYLPSGGTSGVPKIISHRAGAFHELCCHAQFFLSEPLETYTAMYSVLPIFHGFGLCMNMNMCAMLGAKNVMSIKFDPKSMAKAIKKERINVIMGVPAMFSKLLECPQFLKADLSSLKECFVGGDAVPKKLVEDFNAALARGGSKGRLYVGYGLTETVTVCTVNCGTYHKDGSVGYPLPGTELAVVKDGRLVKTGEVGEICVKTPLMMLSYLDGAAHESPVRRIEGSGVRGQGSEIVRYGNPDAPPVGRGLAPAAFAPDAPQNGNNDRWLFTGDLGYLDADGFLFFKQRIKNMIKVSGVPVYPSEVEEAVESIPWILRAAAVGIPDEKLGEAVKLYVEAPIRELKKFFENPADHDAVKKIITEQCEKKLIRYAVPKVIEIRESLPLNSIGKVDRKKLQ